MSIPKSPPQNYTSSRQLIAGSDINNLSDRVCSFQTLTPTGATQATAAPIDAANVEIPAGAAAAGIRLPISYPGAEVCVLNNSANTQNIYPGVGDQVQNAANAYAAANAAVTAATNTSYIFICIKKGFWQRTATS